MRFRSQNRKIKYLITMGIVCSILLVIPGSQSAGHSDDLSSEIEDIKVLALS